MTIVDEQNAIEVDARALTQFVKTALERLGVPGPSAAVAAEAMVRTDIRGQHTHGVYYLKTYVAGLRGGGIVPDAVPMIVQETPATAVVDGGAALGAVVMMGAVDIADRKARAAGCATVLIRNSNPFGAAGIYTTTLAERGLIGIVAANTIPSVGMPGAFGPVFGTNPISYAVPDPDGEGVIMLDMALSQVAGTKVAQLATKGLPIPEGWLVGPDGQPTTDVESMRAGGALTPVGAHKGYGLGMLVEILAGVLSGAGVLKGVRSHDPSHPSNTGHWLTALDPDAFMPLAEFKDRLAALRSEIASIPTAAEVAQLVLPGTPEAQHEAASLEYGLELESFIWDDLRQVAADIGLADELEAARR